MFSILCSLIFSDYDHSACHLHRLIHIMTNRTELIIMATLILNFLFRLVIYVPYLFVFQNLTRSFSIVFQASDCSLSLSTNSPKLQICKLSVFKKKKKKVVFFCLTFFLQSCRNPELNGRGRSRSQEGVFCFGEDRTFLSAETN